VQHKGAASCPTILTTSIHNATNHFINYLYIGDCISVVSGCECVVVSVGLCACVPVLQQCPALVVALCIGSGCLWHVMTGSEPYLVLNWFDWIPPDPF